ncbi:TolC family protein [Candidatus Fermentibacteria bacterium]|nr:TolC family protein [Candidatus Fermentibacteria bacterium]
MIKRCCVVIWLPVVLAAAALHAGEERTLTLEQAVHIALDRNPQMLIAEKEVAKARAVVWEAFGALMPTLEATAVVNHSWEIQTTTIPNFLKPMLEPLAPSIPEFADMPDFVEMSFGMENLVTYGASLRQPLFLGGAGIAGVRLAKVAREASEQQLESRRQNLIYGTTRAFYGCLLAKELVRVQEDALAQAEANLAAVEAQHEVGSASGFDKMRSEVEVANLKPDVISSRNDYRSALTGLRTILGLPADSQIAVDGDLTFVPDDYGDQPLSSLRELADENRPELHAMRAQKTMASRSVAIAKSGFLPKVFFSTDYSNQASRNDWDFTGDDFSKGFSSAISVQLPLFDGLRNVKAHQKAQLDYRIADDRERQLADAVAGEVEVARNGLQVASEKCAAAQESVALAREALRLANLRYEEGASTQLDVLGSQLAMQRAELNHVSALFEYQMARYGLRLATGTLGGLL